MFFSSDCIVLIYYSRQCLVVKEAKQSPWKSPKKSIKSSPRFGRAYLIEQTRMVFLRYWNFGDAEENHIRFSHICFFQIVIRRIFLCFWEIWMSQVTEFVGVLEFNFLVLFRNYFREIVYNNVLIFRKTLHSKRSNKSKPKNYRKPKQKQLKRDLLLVVVSKNQAKNRVPLLICNIISMFYGSLVSQHHVII